MMIAHSPENKEMKKSGLQRKIAIRIHLRDAGKSVIDFLSGRFRYQSRIEWLRDMEAGRIRLNEKPVSAGLPLAPGDILSYHPPEHLEPQINPDYEIVYRDDAILVIDKPGNLPCHPGGRYFAHTLWGLLKTREGLENIHFVHRLDRETSGLVLVVKDPETARICQARFEAGTVRKVYQVLVEGDFPSEPMIVEGYLTPDTSSPVRKKRRFVSSIGKEPISAAAQYCRTRFRLLKRHGKISLIEARPETGRLHQIRATLCSMGYPVVGDKLYGVDDTLFLRFIEDRLTPEDRIHLRIGRQALHASELGFRHPRTGAQLLYQIPIPLDMGGQ
jgi:RluA family pseudouridine synthase